MLQQYTTVINDSELVLIQGNTCCLSKVDVDHRMIGVMMARLDGKIKTIWAWLGNEYNDRALKTIGAVVAAIVAAGWTYHSNKSVDTNHVEAVDEQNIPYRIETAASSREKARACLKSAHLFFVSDNDYETAKNYRCAIKYLDAAWKLGDGSAASALVQLYAEPNIGQLLAIEHSELTSRSINIWCEAKRAGHVRLLSPQALRALNPDFPENPRC